MPIPKTVWTEIWNRAEREPLGLYLKFTEAEAATWHLRQAKPSTMSNYSISRCTDPQILLLVAPSVNLDTEHTVHALRQITSDITIDEDPLP
jgi:hypothetical protein